MSDSYFAALGKQQLFPFTDEKLDYAETAPNAEKAMNESIDRNIKVRTQDFAQHIAAYNVASQYGLIDGLKSISQLTKTGATAINQIQTYKDNEADYDELVDANSNPETVSRFASIEKRAQELRNMNDGDLQAEIGKIEETGFDSEGMPVGNLELLELKKMIASEDIRSGRAAVKNMPFYLPQFMEVAKNSLVVNGKLYADMTLAEKQEWYRIAGARYIEIWTQEYPQITKGQLINDFMPTWTGRLATDNSQAFSSESSAVNTVTQGSSDQYYFDTIKINAEKTNDSNYTEPIGDEIYHQDGFIANRAKYYQNKGYGKNSMKAANADWVALVKRGIDKGVFNDQEIEYILEDLKFVPKGSNKETNYQTLQSGNANEIRQYYNESKEKESLDWQKGRLDYLEGRFENDDIPVTREMISTITDPTLQRQAEILVEKSQTPVFDRGEFKGIKGMMTDLVQARVADRNVFDKKVLDTNWQVQKYHSIYRDAGTFFKSEFNRLSKLGVDDPLSEAATNTITAINNGDFDKNTFEATPKDTKLTVAKLSGVYRADPAGAISAEKPHEGEEAFLVESLPFFQGKTQELPGYWKSISHLYKNKSSIKLAHDRLVATGMMKPIPELMGDINLGLTTSILIDDRPSDAKINRIAVENENGDLNKLLKAVVNPKTEENGGVDAIQKDGKYVELEKPLSQHTVGEIITLMESGHDNFGLYGIRREGMIQLMQSLPTLDYTALFDERMQQKLLLARLRYKTNNKLAYANADFTYRRLVNIPEEDREEYAKIIGEIPPFLELDTLLPIAATAQVENTLQ
tara:strand:- start:526 stop:2940 length:2415 start_codon:yes stop_codon:yes gene_type:complete